MRDALAPNGMLAPVRESPTLAEQFPNSCYMRQHVRNDLTVQKLILLRTTTLKSGRRRRAMWPHMLWPEDGSRCTVTGMFGHYTMTPDQIPLTAFKAADKLQQNPRHTYYPDLLAFLELANRTDVRNHSYCKAPPRAAHKGRR
jgi:hypothetical protein